MRLYIEFIIILLSFIILYNIVNYLFSTKEGFRRRFRIKRVGRGITRTANTAGKGITKTANVAGDGLSNNELTKNMDSMGKDIAGIATQVASIQKKIKEAEKEVEKEVEAADKVKELNENKEDIAEEYNLNDDDDDDEDLF